MGHLFLGRDLVRDTARELGDVDPELVRLLEHLVITHLTLPEWGSPKLPLIPEALILHHADDLDAKLEMYARCLLPGPIAGAVHRPGSGAEPATVQRAEGFERIRADGSLDTGVRFAERKRSMKKKKPKASARSRKRVNHSSRPTPQPGLLKWKTVEE